jgi:alanine racemase
MSPIFKDSKTLQSWCDISSDALTHNVAVFRRRLALGTCLGVVVKSNAYGHGLVGASKIFLDAGADWLIVNAVDEALALRQAGFTVPIYICGPISPDSAEDVVHSGARVTLYDRALADALASKATALGRVVPVHLKLETGNHRQGIAMDELVQLAEVVADTPGLELEGLSTHFADIEDTTDHRFSRIQLEELALAHRHLQEKSIEPKMVHSANSAAAILWPEAHGDLVRVGIAAYGLWPSRETYVTALQVRQHGQEDGFIPELRPALTWRARIAQVKSVPAGSFIGYGRTYRTTQKSKIAILPVGYHEGYDRRLSNLAHVLIGGLRAPVRGRVCMNMTMVDVSHVEDAQVGQAVTLLGKDGSEEVTAEMLAGWMGTINYEVVSRIHALLPRVFGK